MSDEKEVVQEKHTDEKTQLSEEALAEVSGGTVKWNTTADEDTKEPVTFNYSELR